MIGIVEKKMSQNIIIRVKIITQEFYF